MKDFKLHLIFFFLACPGFVLSQFNDTAHYSDVYERDKPYRIFSPDDYETSTKNYPVVYFFHGWGGDHTNYGNANMDHDDISAIVNRDSAILVMVNGRSDDADPFPYNIGNDQAVKYQEQFKDYFLEIVQHIDDTYRTIPIREKRMLMGFSMGGFTSFYLAGKYPHMVCTAVNVVGSPELDMGYPGNHTLYPQRYTMENLHGVNLRFHNSTTGELKDLNQEVHEGAIREKGLLYMYRVYPGGHQFNTIYESDIFEETYQWVLASMNNPLPKPERWHHLDLYPDFSVWDYEVNSNLAEPGYIEMKGVTDVGMRTGTKKWLPNGVIMSGVTMNVKTAPVYEPDSEYTLFDYNQTLDSSSSTTVVSDAEGRISFSADQDIHHYGFINGNTPPEVVFIDYVVDDTSKFLVQGKEGIVKVKLLNRGGKATGNVQVKITTIRDGVVIIDSISNIADLEPGETTWLETGFRITADYSAPSNAAPFATRFDLELSDGGTNIWLDEFDVPVFFSVHGFSGIIIDDGIKVSDEIFGEGNADGIADPGETVMLYVFDDVYANQNRRLRLYYDDPYVELQKEKVYEEILPSKWILDGTTVSSIIKIADNCPKGHIINCLANYEYKEYNPINRIVTWGIAPLGVGCKVPDTPDKPEGISAICQGSSDTYYETDTVDGATSYEWAISPEEAGTIIGEGPKISVAWSGTFSGDADITVKATDDCISGYPSEPLTVSVITFLDRPVKPVGDSTLCENPGESVYIIESVKNTTYYEWFISPVEAGTISGIDTVGTVDWSGTFTGLAAISVKAYMDCAESDTSDELTVNIGCNSLSDNKRYGFEIFPNPAKDFLLLKFDNLKISRLNIEIIDINGQLLFKNQVETVKSLNKIDLPDFSEGVYSIRLITEEFIACEKLIIYQ